MLPNVNISKTKMCSRTFKATLIFEPPPLSDICVSIYLSVCLSIYLSFHPVNTNYPLWPVYNTLPLTRRTGCCFQGQELDTSSSSDSEDETPNLQSTAHSQKPIVSTVEREITVK